MSDLQQWVYFLHPPRSPFIGTVTDEEDAVFAQHFSYLARLHAEGTLIVAGPTLGEINTGIHIFEAADLGAAEAIMAADPAISSGLCTGELRPMRVSLLRGQD